jgi:hypothetical protein
MRKNRKSNRDDLPRFIKIKKYKLLFTYHFRNLWRRLFNNWPIILFVLSFILFILILIPNILHRFPIFGEWPRVLELDGSVSIEKKDVNSTKFIRVAGAKVEIGGYESVTDAEGKFNIKFVSKSWTNIPVIIQWSNNSVIQRVSFDSNKFQITEVFFLHEE